MAINERLIDTKVAAAAPVGNEAEQGLILHLDANDVDSYDGDGTVWYDISEYDVTIPLSDNADDLELHLNASDSTSYDPATDTTTWTDISGNSNDATLTSLTNTDYDIDNGGFFTLDGASDFASNTSVSLETDSGSYSTEMWFNADTIATNDFLFQLNGVGTSRRHLLYFNSTSTVRAVSYRASDLNNSASATSGTISTGTWHHVVAVFKDNTYLKLYVNGVEVATTSSNITDARPTSYDEYYIGKEDDFGQKFDGKIGAVRYYSKALSASEVGQNYRHGRDIVYTDLIPDRASFTEGSVTTGAELELDANDYSGSGNWLDSSGNSNDGTIYGATYVDDGNSDYFDFDGVADYVQTSYNPTGLNSITAEYWVNADAVGATESLGVVFFNGGGRIDFAINSNSNNIPSVSLNLVLLNKTDFIGNWNQVTIVLTGLASTYNTGGSYASAINASIYYNGEFINTVNPQPYQTPVLGARLGRTGGGYYLNGKIGQARIYPSALTLQQVQTNYDATKGLYAYPDLALHLDAASFDGSTNTPSTWTDSSGNGNNGTISGATFDSELGNWLDFDGLNDEVVIPMSFSGGGSIEMWVNITDVNANNQICSKYTSGTDNRSFAWYVYNSGGVGKAVFSIYYNSSGNGNSVEFDMQDYFTSGKWHHIMHTFDASNRPTLYVDGEAIPVLSQYNSASQNVVYSRPSVPVVLGQTDGSTNDTYDFDGKIGQFRIYDSRLTQDQIRQNYNFTKNNYPNGINASLTNVSWAANYFEIDSSSDAIEFGNGLKPYLDGLTTALSASYWIRFDDLNATQNLFAYYNSSLGGDSAGFSQSMVESGKLQWYVSPTSGTTNGRTTSVCVTANTWHHVVMVLDMSKSQTNGTGGRVQIFVDETEQSITYTESTGSTTLRTGSASLKPSFGFTTNSSGTKENHFDGRVSKIKIFDKALTQEEITTLHSEGE